MSSSLVIEAADTTGRWYLLPGASNAYDLTVKNESEHALVCKFSLDEPAEAGAVLPSSMTIKAGESRSVSVSFKPEWLTLRDRKAIVSARNAAGTILATFVHDLVAATSTDCSVSLAWKDEIAGEGALRGFILSCMLRSISSTPGVFQPEFVPHPSLRFPEPARITLGPGETVTFDVPVVWNRSTRDAEGWNHPRTIEVAVPVTHGRRTSAAPWDLVQRHIEPYLTDADRAPAIVRRPPQQFAQPASAPAAPPVSPLAASATQSEGLLQQSVVTESPSARMERAVMEAGVASTGVRLTPSGSPNSPQQSAERETIAVAPATLLLVGLAFAAIAIVLVWMLRPAPQAPPSANAVPAPVHTHVLGLGSAGRKGSLPPFRAARARAEANKAAASQTTAPAATQSQEIATHAGASSTAASRSAPSGSASRAATGAQRAAAPQRVSAVDRSALVQLGTVDAEYAHGGRSVHVYWDSYAQASADVQLLNARSAIIAETNVGRRLGAMLSLPRGYRGPVYVQVTAIGYHGERVVGSASLAGQ